MSTIIRPDATVVGKINQHKQDLRNLEKNHFARIKDLHAQQNATAKQAADTAAIANANQVTTQVVKATSNVVGPNGQPLYGWSGGSSLFPLSNDNNTGSSWATGERGYINNLNTAVNFIWQVLLDNGIVT